TVGGARRADRRDLGRPALAGLCRRARSRPAPRRLRGHPTGRQGRRFRADPRRRRPGAAFRAALEGCAHGRRTSATPARRTGGRRRRGRHLRIPGYAIGPRAGVRGTAQHPLHGCRVAGAPVAAGDTASFRSTVESGATRRRHQPPHCAGKRSRRMPHIDTPPDIAARQGIRIETAHERALPAERDAALAMLRPGALHPSFVPLPDGPCAVQFEPAPALLKLAPQRDTTGLCTALGLDTHGNADDLAREIVLAMLLGPEPFPFPGAAEMRSAVRIRQHIVQAARKTALAFDTEHAERPAGYWRYDDARGFTIEPGVSLIDALRKATQPEASGKLYSFSCYRATEYVTLLGIALELQAA